MTTVVLGMAQNRLFGTHTHTHTDAHLYDLKGLKPLNPIFIFLFTRSHSLSLAMLILALNTFNWRLFYYAVHSHAAQLVQLSPVEAAYKAQKKALPTYERRTCAIEIAKQRTLYALIVVDFTTFYAIIYINIYILLFHTFFCPFYWKQTAENSLHSLSLSLALLNCSFIAGIPCRIVCKTLSICPTASQSCPAPPASRCFLLLPCQSSQFVLCASAPRSALARLMPYLYLIAASVLLAFASERLSSPRLASWFNGVRARQTDAVVAAATATAIDTATDTITVTVTFAD